MDPEFSPEHKIGKDFVTDTLWQFFSKGISLSVCSVHSYGTFSESAGRESNLHIPSSIPLILSIQLKIEFKFF